MPLSGTNPVLSIGSDGLIFSSVAGLSVFKMLVATVATIS
jgi:hypothetical protein